MSFRKLSSIKLLFLTIMIMSCSNDDDSIEPCPEVENQSQMIIESPDLNVYTYDMNYSYLDREGVNDDGHFVYQFIYSNYDIENISEVENGYFLKFRITTPEDIPDGAFTLNNPVKNISDVETFYDYTFDGEIGRIDVTDMTVTFSNFDSCLNHEVEVSFSDTEFSPGTIGNGVFNGKSNLYTIQ